MPTRPMSVGPMNTQPAEHGSFAAPMLPRMPGPIEDPGAPSPPKKITSPKKRQTRTDAVRLAKARIMRRNSLRKQRLAQKG